MEGRVVHAVGDHQVPEECKECAHQQTAAEHKNNIAHH